jgi:hypothetical protein
MAGAIGSIWAGLARLCFALAVAGAVIAMPSRGHAAGGAYIVDDADIGKPGSCQAENWVSTATNHDFTGVVSPACVVQIGLPIEFTGTYQRNRAEGIWTTAPFWQAKIVPINNDKFAFSLSGAVIYDSFTRSLSSFINMPLTFKFGKDFRIHTNLGWLHDERVNIDFATGGVGFDWDFDPKFSLMGEIYLQEGRQPPLIPSSVYEPRTQLGLRYMPIGTVDIDLIYGHNITGLKGHWLTFGVTVRSE